MEVLVRWDDGVQNIVPSEDLRKVHQSNKTWKKVRRIQKFKEGERIKMWYNDKWFFGTVLFIDRDRNISDYASVSPPGTPVTTINSDNLKEETLVCNDDNTNDSGNLNIVLSEPFTLEESFNFNEKHCEENDGNKSIKEEEQDKPLTKLKEDCKNKNISSIRTRRKEYAQNKNQDNTETITYNKMQVNKNAISPALVLKPCSVVVEDSIAKCSSVADFCSVNQDKGSGLAGEPEPVPTKLTGKTSMKSTMTLAALKQANKTLSKHVRRRRKAYVIKPKQNTSNKGAKSVLLTTAEFLDTNLSTLSFRDFHKLPQTTESSRENINNVLKIPPSLEVILKDSNDTGKMSTTKTCSSTNKNNDSGETRPISVQVFIKDPKTKNVISQAALADIRRNAKANINSDKSNSAKAQLGFIRSLSPYKPPIKYSECMFSSISSKQSNLGALNKNKLTNLDSNPNDTEMHSKRLKTSNSSENITRSANGQNSENSSLEISTTHLSMTPDFEMVPNDRLNYSDIADNDCHAVENTDKSEESQDERTSDSVLTLEELIKSGDAVSLDPKYNELENYLSSPAVLLSSSQTKRVISPSSRNTLDQFVGNKTKYFEPLNNPSHEDKPNEIINSKKVLKEVGKPVEPALEECLDGVPPFIKTVFECANIRDGFIASDLVFVLSLLPDLEEMTDSQKIKFQVKVIEMINDIMNDPQLTYAKL